jgi:hypothetical protein
MIDRYFREHPRSVGETYFQHLRSASWFAAVMLSAGVACFIHALVPRLFRKTGSTAIEQLYDRMVINRDHAPLAANASRRPIEPF